MRRLMNCTISTSDASRPSKQKITPENANPSSEICVFLASPQTSPQTPLKRPSCDLQESRPPAPKPKPTEKRPPRKREIWQSFSLAAVYPKQTPLEIGQSPVSVTPCWREPSSEVLLPKGKATAHLLKGFSAATAAHSETQYPE